MQKYELKKKWNQKSKIPHTILERRSLGFNSHKNYKLKVKLWWVGARQRITTVFFYICVLSQCIVHWIHFQNIHTFTYRETSLHILLCLFLKSSKAFSVSLSLRDISGTLP